MAVDVQPGSFVRGEGVEGASLDLGCEGPLSLVRVGCSCLCSSLLGSSVLYFVLLYIYIYILPIPIYNGDLNLMSDLARGTGLILRVGIGDLEGGRFCLFCWLLFRVDDLFMLLSFSVTLVFAQCKIFRIALVFGLH